MACEDKLFLNDEGTSIRFLVKECNDTDPDNPFEELVDVSSASNIEITFKKPDDTTSVTTGSFVTDGTDSLIHYITEVSFLDQIGTWKGQARITMPTGKWYTSLISFKVSDKL